MRRFGRTLAASALVGGLSLCPVAATWAETNDGNAVDADNSDRNERDRDGTSLTPLDQGTSDSDVAITQAIRKEITSNDAFSMNAKNVKIITRDGVVTLRGPVKSADEKAQIAALAARPKGVKSVDDEIEIETND